MPLDFGDPDEDSDSPGGFRPRSRFPVEEARHPWWRPASTIGRVVLGSCALLVLGGLTAAGMALRLYLHRDAGFRIAGTQDIQASGLTEVTRAQLLPVFGEDIGRNIFFVPLGARRRQLEQLPWIEHATVMRLLPDRIQVAVFERQPVAFTRNGRRIGLVDANGVLLSMTPAAMARHHYSFPVLTGIDPGDSPSARKTRMAVYMRLMSDLDSTGQHDSQQISEIDLTDPEDARILMPEPGGDVLAHFGEDHFLERFERYKAHIAEWRQQYPHLSSVDLRYEQQVVLQMASEQAVSAPDAKPLAGEPAAASKPAAIHIEAKPKRVEAKPKHVEAKSKHVEAKPRANSSAVRRHREIEATHRAAQRRAALIAARRRAAYMVLHEHDRPSRGTTTSTSNGIRNRARTTPVVAQGG